MSKSKLINDELDDEKLKDTVTEETGPEDEDEEELEDEETDDVEDDEEEELDESAEENKASLTPKSKSHMLMQSIEMLAGMSKEDLSHFMNDALAQIGKEADLVPDGAAAKNKASVAMNKQLKEDLALILGEEKASDEFKTKVSTIFEAAVNSRVALIREELKESITESVEKSVNEKIEELSETLDSYLEILANKWLEENEVAINRSIKQDLTESFMKDLRDVFIKHDLDVPEEEEKIDVLEALTDEVEDLKTRLNESLNTQYQLAEALNDYQVDDLIEESAVGMTTVDVEKFRKLAEDLEYDGDAEVFKNKLSIIKETYFGKVAKDTKITDDEIIHSDDETVSHINVSPEMRRYMDAISRTIVK